MAFGACLTISGTFKAIGIDVCAFFLASILIRHVVLPSLVEPLLAFLALEEPFRKHFGSCGHAINNFIGRTLKLVWRQSEAFITSRACLHGVTMKTAWDLLLTKAAFILVIAPSVVGLTLVTKAHVGESRDRV